MSSRVLQACYQTPVEFLRAFDSEIARAGLLVRGAQLERAQAMSECLVEVRIGEGPSTQVPARVAAAVAGVGVAVVFDGVPGPLAELARRHRSMSATPAEESEEPAGPLAERLKAMTGPQKMQLAVSANREARFALLRDPNKAVHVFVLKNPRIGVDEVAWAAKLTTLSPDALKVISESREWTGQPSVVIALVRNPKTPLPIALRLLDRVPTSEIRALAKGGARETIVHAARKKVSSSSS